MKVRLSKDSDELRRFRKPEKVLKWLQEEKQAWAWIENVSAPEVGNFVNSFLKILNSSISDVRIILEQDSEPSEEDINRWLNRISSDVTNGRYLISTSPLATYILETSENESRVAAYMLVLQCDIEQHVQLKFRSSAATAAVQLSNFHDGIGPKVSTTVRNQLNGLSTRFSGLLAETEADAKQVKDELGDQLKRSETRLKRSATTLGRFIKRKRLAFTDLSATTQSEFEAKLNKALEAASSEIEEFKNFYEDQIALLEPVEYWNRKRKSHRNSTIVLGCLFVGYSAGLVSFATREFRKLEIGGLEFLTLWKEIGIEGLAALSFLVALGLIGSRIIYRLFSSQLHLWNDASERVTMIKTYLAFAKRDHAKEEHMQFLIQRLFSPVSDGVVKDEFGTISPADWIASRANR